MTYDVCIVIDSDVCMPTCAPTHLIRQQVGELINEVLDGLVSNGAEGNGQVEELVRERVRLLCQRYPIY